MTSTQTDEYVQFTLEGEETDKDRVRPNTFLWCPETEQWILRSRRHDWPHDLVEEPSGSDSDQSDEEDEDDDDEPEQVGNVFTIELSYNADFRFRIPAYSKHEAEERAKDLIDYPNNCADFFHLHTRRDQGREIYEDDEMLPDDFSPYSGEYLWEAWGADDDESDEEDETDG